MLRVGNYFFIWEADFLASIDAVLTEAAERQVTVMCSESLWWRCHRCLLADFAAVACGVDVRHLTHEGRLEDRPQRMTR